MVSEVKYMSFPDEIKKIRIDSQLSQDAFAKLLGVSRATINRWEQGSQIPSKIALHLLKEYCREHDIEFCFECVLLNGQRI